MQRSYIKWLIAVFVLSVLLGWVVNYYVRPDLPKSITFHHFTKMNIDEDEEEHVIPFPDWDERKRQRALAVIIDNTPYARPQSGLKEAEIVIELPVEGGLTRLLAIISEDDVETIGPIRSARPYFIYLAKEYNSILVHAGGSNESLEILKQIDHLDEIYGGTQVAMAFWRVPDRYKPYNLYASSLSLRKVAKNIKYNLVSPPPQHTYLQEGEEVTGEDATDISIFYSNRSSEARFVYQPEKMVYVRFSGGKIHTTQANEQLVTANVIVQYVPYRYVDGEGHLQLILHGQGEALIFRQGKVTKGQWKKNPDEFTNFVDNKGKEIPLVKGPTWILVVPNNLRVDY